MTEHPADRAQFHAMKDGTQDDWMKIAAAAVPFHRELPDRVLTHLKLLKGDSGGYAIDRFEHSLQSATLAHKDGMDEEYVVCALLHDIGDTLASANHAELGATMLRPFVSEQNHWMLNMHGIFQGYYFFHYLGLDRNMREQYRGHPNFEHTAMFCARHDQNAFDPAYENMPIEAFEPMVRRVMARPKRSIYLRDDLKGGGGIIMADAASHKAILTNVLGAYRLGDFAPVLEALDDGVVWTSNALPGHSRFGGERHGRGGVIEALALIAADYHITRYDVREMIGENEVVWVTSELSVDDKRNHRGIGFTLVARWQFKAGKVVSVSEYFDTASVMQQQGRVAAEIPLTLTA